MYEELIAQVLDEVRRQEPRPTALLLGRRPPQDCGFQYVLTGEHDAVVIGSLSAGELLRFPDEACTEALLAGKAVYLWEDGLDYRKHSRTANRALWSKLLSAERQLKQLGVQRLNASGTRLLTADEVRRRLRDGQRVDGRLTPLARDVLEGRA